MEIGIHKVLGAGGTDIITMLSKDFTLLIVPFLLIASPIAWYFMDSWLRGFAYRIQIGWWMFALAGLFAVFIAMATICFHAIKAAVANPVDSLKTE
jgi:putative ABC transport system permease protein